MSDQMPPSKRAFVTGWPISHSRSPLVHGHWLETLGISGSYEAVATQPGHLPELFERVRSGEFLGGNITIPHKPDVAALVDDISETVSILGAANTVWMKNGRLRADNTDGYGFLANLDQRLPNWDANAADRTALVLGAGGASSAVSHALSTRGFSKIIVANRTLTKAEAMIARLGTQFVAIPAEQAANHVNQCSMIVNTTSLGMESDNQSFEDPFGLMKNLKSASPDTIVTDIVYVPLHTPILIAAKTLGLRTVDGLGMLLHQAVPGFEQWFGKRPAVTEKLRHLILSDLGLDE